MYGAMDSISFLGYPIGRGRRRAREQCLSLEHFSFYHAGLTPVTDVPMTFVRTEDTIFSVDLEHEFSM